MPNVAFVREEIKNLLPQYDLITDCVEGEKKVKYKKTKYLPQPNADDVSEANIERYKAYLERAVFYNVTQRTLLGLTGQIFSKDPVVEIPAELDVINVDANGGGVSLTQIAKRAIMQVLSIGRCGVFVDYPATEAPVSKEDLAKGDIRPTINVYLGGKIINWRTKVRGAKEILSLVVLEEKYTATDDGFEMKQETQWRVLRLNETDVYQVEIWRKAGSYKIAEGPFFPKDAKGNNLNEIPFMFVGAENNDDLPDLPPLYDIASLNIAHYRNSADYEESCFIVGQPTPYFAGLTQDWVDNVLKGRIALGSRAAVPLPENGSAGLLQAEANTMPKEAMEHKENQMTALGAKLVEQKSVQRTATEASIDNASETSILVSSAKNVSSALKFALEKCAAFVGADAAKISFELQTDFAIARMSAEERRQLISEWQGNAITFSEMRSALRKVGVATLDDTEAQNEIEQQMQAAVDAAANEAKALADATGGANNNTPPGQ